MLLDFPLSIVAASLLAFFVSYFSIVWLIKRKNASVLDYPNSRSLHTVPVSRVGGVGLLFGALSVWIAFSAVLPVPVWLGIIALSVISFADDIWSMPVGYRLFVHTLTALGFCITLLLDAYGWLPVMICALAVIWTSNLFNFMDGSDGLAGGMVLVGFGYYGLAAYLSGNVNFALVNFSLAAASLGFLFHNFYPARIFLGDVGAVPLGYFAAVMGLLGWINDLWSLWLPLLIFSPFIADATATLIKRSFRGEKIWMAHREHYYQRMVQSGFGHRNTALLGYGLMLIVGACALWVNNQDMNIQFMAAAIWGFIYLGLMLMADLGKKPYSGDI
ncbi:MraY family glycosyltransferase [Nitrosomonas aestuarii]|uniref:MraY family glycosyltransferase n=1 Tax=Nitrosomonas aestuarii TaxID=52441 RepID=UPI000D31F7D8|nr:glycosyltransferase family 4 protein [Nitrosomonas aestuarii]PTN11487.1 UDP-N-acetylmuramyl pentapeptide phosphotransferase/UDP-N-acetylglucosamine-1-phosphate transferase [Nitrosomonas aestuarii]